MGYGRRFRASLPPAPVTYELDDIGEFFAAEPSTTAERTPYSDRTEAQ